MNPEDYIRGLLGRPIVPEYCAWPAWLGLAFKMEDYSNFTCEVEIHHGCNGDAWAPGRKCKFIATPLTIVETGVCPVCGKQEVTPFNDPKRLELNAKEVYRKLVKAYSDRAMRYYLVDNWDNLRAINKGKLHVDHIYPVSLGFGESVPEIIIGSPVNCRLVTGKRNVRKATHPGQSLQDLLFRYDSLVAECPIWAGLELILAETGTLKGAVKPRTRLQHIESLRAIIGDPISDEKEVTGLVDKAQTVKRKRSPKRRTSGIEVVFEIELDTREEKP